MTLALLALLATPFAEAKKKTEAPAPAPVAVPAADPAATKAQAEALWAQRGDQAKLREALTAYEQVLAAAPTDRDALYHLLRGYYFLGDGHLTVMDEKLVVWEKAITYGNQCLALNTEYAALLQKGDEDPATATRTLKVDDVPCIYWTSSALGKWAKASGLMVTLRHLPTVKAYMTKVGELEPTYYYNGPDRYWGAYYAAIPSFSGQDLKKSREYFDKALAAYPTFLGTHVLVAEQWAIKSQDKETFKKELEWVMAADATVLPEVQPEMEAAKRQAAALLAAPITDNFAN